MPHNTGCNRLIQEGKASIVCSLTEIDELCHGAHRPESVDGADGGEDERRETPYAGSGTTVLNAIGMCGTSGNVTADDVLAKLDETHPGEYSVARVMRDLGSLELEGLIDVRSGRISIIGR